MKCASLYFLGGFEVYLYFGKATGRTEQIISARSDQSEVRQFDRAGLCERRVTEPILTLEWRPACDEPNVPCSGSSQAFVCESITGWKCDVERVQTCADSSNKNKSNGWKWFSNSTEKSCEAVIVCRGCKKLVCVCEDVKSLSVRSLSRFET